MLLSNHVRRNSGALLAVFLLVHLFGGNAVVFGQSRNQFASGVVAADHHAASEAGASMLQQGGNVVDAAVATSFALSVVRPASCGIGGGGFMVIWDVRNQRAVAIDYRERAPAAATAEMYLNESANHETESGSVRGATAAGIPGTVAGLCYAAETYGSLPLKTLLQPAIDLCINGVPVDEIDIETQASILQKIRRTAGYEKRFATLIEGYLNRGTLWKVGDRFYSPQRKILERIAAEGRSGFYEGEVAAAIEAAVRADGGILTRDDLESFVPTERNVLRGQFHGDTILTMPPPSSGGIALLQTLNALEAWEHLSGRPLADLQQNSPPYVHTITECLKHAFADRAEYLGDTDFVQVPVEQLLSPKYAQQIAEKVDSTKTRDATAYGRFFGKSDSGTSHFSVIDREGNAVACTETINLTYGSFFVVPDYGILLNDQMDDFSARPGEPNAFGLMQSAANVVAPGKKPLSSMTPTILIRDGRAVYSTGASGGPRIITATLQSVLNHSVFGLSPSEAVAAPRFHHQWFPNELLVEKTLAAQLSSPLHTLGHDVKPASSLAAAQAVGRSSEGLAGGSDPRKHGQAAGF